MQFFNDLTQNIISTHTSRVKYPFFGIFRPTPQVGAWDEVRLFHPGSSVFKTNSRVGLHFYFGIADVQKRDQILVFRKS